MGAVRGSVAVTNPRIVSLGVAMLPFFTSLSAPVELSGVWKEKDRDNDGVLSLEEFQTPLDWEITGAGDGFTGHLFKMADEDNDGKLAGAEVDKLPAVMKRLNDRLQEI